MMKKHHIYILIGVCLILTTPIGIDKLIIGNSFPSNISNTEWVGFLGSYIGALIGGLISLIGIILTIRFTREQNRKDRELQIRPYMDITYYADFYKYKPVIHDCLGFIRIETYANETNVSDKHGLIFLYIKNIGAGSAVNIEFDVIPTDLETKNQAYFTNMNWRVTTNSLRPGENAWVSVEIWGNDKAPKSDELMWDKQHLPMIDYTKFRIPANFSIKAIMRYNDLLGNQFRQELLFHTSYMMSYEDNTEPKYKCDIHLEKVAPPEMI